MRKLISDFPVDEKIELTVRRVGPGGSVTVPATGPASMPAARSETKTFSVTTDKLESVLAEQMAIPWAWNMTVRELTRSYLRKVSLFKEGAAIQGVLVTSTETGQRADRAKLQNGDIIISVNDKKVTSIQRSQ